jgi:hypothetical protein
MCGNFPSESDSGRIMLPTIMDAIKEMHRTNAAHIFRGPTLHYLDVQTEMANILTGLHTHGFITEFVISVGNNEACARFFFHQHSYKLTISPCHKIITLVAGVSATGLYFHGFDPVVGRHSYVGRFQEDWRLSDATYVAIIIALQRYDIYADIRDIICGYLQDSVAATGLLDTQMNLGGLCCNYFPPSYYLSRFTFMPTHFENSV